MEKTFFFPLRVLSLAKVPFNAESPLFFLVILLEPDGLVSFVAGVKGNQRKRDDDVPNVSGLEGCPRQTCHDGPTNPANPRDGSEKTACRWVRNCAMGRKVRGLLGYNSWDNCRGELRHP